jgi:hypothetical protein
MNNGDGNGSGKWDQHTPNGTGYGLSYSAMHNLSRGYKGKNPDPNYKQDQIYYAWEFDKLEHQVVKAKLPTPYMKQIESKEMGAAQYNAMRGMRWNKEMCQSALEAWQAKNPAERNTNDVNNAITACLKGMEADYATLSGRHGQTAKEGKN